MSKLSGVAFLSFLVIACGPKEPAQPAPETTAAPTTAPEPEPTKPPPETPKEPAPLTPSAKPFHDLTDDEKRAHMKDVIVPAMRDRFQAFDATQFAKFTCATCHGPKGRENNFKMPNPELTKLPKTPEGFQKLAETKGPAMEFMKTVVVPSMATMLSEPVYDPATNKGFACMNCHTQE